MDPATVALILQLLLKYGPEIAQKAQQLFKKTAVTDDDWTALWGLIEKKGEDYFAPQVKP